MINQAFHIARKFNKSGQSMVQMLVSIGIMGIMMMSLISMLQTQNNEVRALKEKLATADLQVQLTRGFSDGAVCSSLLTGRTFTVTGSGVVLPSINLTNTSIPISTLPGAPALVAANAPISAISNTVFAAPTNTFQVRDITGSTVGNVGHYMANFVVNLDTSRMVRSLKPIVTQISMRTSGAGATKTITNCQDGGSGDTVSVPIATLSNYHNACTPFAGPYTAPQLMACLSACNRYCGGGCLAASGNCSGTLPGLGYSGGVMTEVNLTSAECSCIP